MYENGDDNEDNDDDDDNDEPENDELTRQVVAAVGICWDGFHSLSLQVLPTPPCCCCTWKKSNKKQKYEKKFTRILNIWQRQSF